MSPGEFLKPYALLSVGFAGCAAFACASFRTAARSSGLSLFRAAVAFSNALCFTDERTSGFQVLMESWICCGVLPFAMRRRMKA